MNIFVYRYNSPQKQAKWLMALVGWVLAVCLIQNAGIVSSCPMKSDYAGFAVVADETGQDVKAKGVTKCELSEKLIQFAKHHLELFIAILFVGITFIAVSRLGAFTQIKQWTEPIPGKHRVHLTFCVFRE